MVLKMVWHCNMGVLPFAGSERRIRACIHERRRVAESSHPQQSRAALTLLAFGVVFGDIGTSPLYAVKETFGPGHGIALTAENVFGGLSTIFWALMIVVSLEYVMLLMRAANRGEGGIMA